MIILPCKVKSFNVKEKEIAVSITISDSVLQKNPEAVSELLSLKNANLNLALAPRKLLKKNSDNWIFKLDALIAIVTMLGLEKRLVSVLTARKSFTSSGRMPILRLRKWRN